MKKIISLLFVLVFTIFTVIGVRADGMNLKSVDTIISEIRREQNIQSTETIDISKVSLAKLEELGDSVMEKVIGNTDVHDRMDIALGGDGSISLTNVHIRVGTNYLAGIPITMMTFMGASGMMGGYGYYNQNNYPSGYGGMMGNFGWEGMLLGGVFFIILLITLFYFITKKSRFTVRNSDDSAVNIAKERYSKGEINRDEFLKLIEDLNK